MCKRRQLTYVVVAFGLAASGAALAQEPVGTAFTFQGMLNMNGQPLTDTADFEVRLTTEDGGQIGDEVTADNVELVNGMFVLPLDFGPSPWASDTAYYLEVKVRSHSGSGEFTTLDPRPRVAPTPVSLATRGITVDSVGKVGIGTSTPQEQVHVAGGDVWLEGGLRVGNSLFFEQYPDETPCTDCITASSGTINFDDENLITTGDVGIGETNPYERLHVTKLDVTDDFNNWVCDDDVVIEDAGAPDPDDDKAPWVGLYTDDEGERRAGITLAEVQGQDQGDKWSIFREHDLACDVPHLHITYGPDQCPTNNEDRMKIRQNGSTLLAPVHGDVGIGFDDDLYAKLHVRNVDVGPAFNDWLSYEDVVIEDSKSFLGLYSDNEGGYAGITLAKVQGTNQGDKWSIFRDNELNGDSVLRITHGNNRWPPNNAEMMKIWQTGETWVNALIAETEIYKRYTPDTRDPAAPLAYGRVQYDGTLLSGTPNISAVAWDAFNQRYQISIAGVSVDHLHHVTVLTTSSIYVATLATAYSSGGDLLVTCWNTATGARVQEGFSLVIYDPTS